MKILQMCNDIFGEYPQEKSVKAFFRRKLKEEKEGKRKMTDKGFFYWIIQYLGGRSYNCYLDYSLFAIKINTIMDQFHTWKEGQNESMKEAVEDLLWDDRHDCWQNLPYSLERFVEPMEKEKQEIFWDLIVEAMIQCINVEGTGDVSPKFYVKER